MSAAHTPGPWIVTGSGRIKYVEARIGNGMLQEVASCMICEKGDFDANARLIAAAPDLLEALQNIANGNPLNWDAPHNDYPTFHAWAQSRARAAIAKAVQS